MGMSKRDYQVKLSKIRKANVQKQYKQSLRAEKQKYNTKHIETSKLLAIYLFVLFNVVLIYAMVAMWVMHDLTYLGVLISDIVAQVLTYAIYCMKAYCAKRQSENLKFCRERYIQEQADNTDDGTVDDILAAGSESEEPVVLANGTTIEPFSYSADDCAI